MAKHDICWVEFSSTDIKRTKKFFRGLFHWTFEDYPDDYTVIKTPAGVKGGIAKADKVVPGNSPAVYVQVDEIEPYLLKAVELGGKVIVPKKEIPNTGFYAVVADPDGSEIGLYLLLP